MMNIHIFSMRGNMLRRLFASGGTSSTGGELGREFSVGDVLEQRYEIEQVRRGYMGIVYIAYDRQRRGRVAIKTFQNKFLWDDEAIRRFNGEAELWMRLGSHPNIVRAYDLKHFLGKPHVIAEYVHGGPLRTLVRHLSLQEALDYAIQVCWGMAYAVEQAGIIHCDIKPDNIMMTVDGQAKVTDFGLARAIPTAHMLDWQHRRRSVVRSKAATTMGGTLPYMAPELFDHPPHPDTWSDIYAFGVMLYELMTGRLPFDSNHDESLIRMHRSQQPLDPREYVPTLDTAGAAIALRCMGKQPSSRYARFGDIERDLQEVRASVVGERYVVVWPADASAERDRWSERGQMHMELGEYSEALTCFRQAASLDETIASVWLNLARARLRLWQYNESLNAIEQGLQRSVGRNEFGELYQLKGETLAAMLRPREAIAAYDKGLSYTPNSPGLWRERGGLLLKNGLPREAEQCLETALRYDKLDSLAWRLLGDIHIAQNHWKQAHRALGESLKLDPRSAIGWTRYGYTQLKLERATEAIKSFEFALKLDEDMQEANEGLRLARAARR